MQNSKRFAPTAPAELGWAACGQEVGGAPVRECQRAVSTEQFTCPVQGCCLLPSMLASHLVHENPKFDLGAE